MAALNSLFAIQMRWRFWIAFDGHLRDGGNGLGLVRIAASKPAPNCVRDQSRLHRADPIHVRMVRQEVGQAVRVHFQVLASCQSAANCRPYFGWSSQLAFQPNGIVLPDEYLAGKRNDSPSASPQAARGECRRRVEDRFNDAAETIGFLGSPALCHDSTSRARASR